jgi:serine protease AprX
MRKLPIISLLIVCSLLFASSTPVVAARWESKVEPWVLETGSRGTTEFLVLLREQADLSPASRMESKAERGQFVYHALTATAQRSQPPIIAALQRLGVEYRSYWIVNAIWVRGDLNAITALAQRADVRHLYANPSVMLEAPVKQATLEGLTEGIEWNITLVGAPEVWALGYTGQGVVVGGADTGYYWEHAALKNQYRGWNGVIAQHDYNWFDATAAHSLVPVDPYGHGTHTMGTIVGDDGGSHQIGMAPGASWIGCRNMDASGIGSPETYIACYQWFVAPTRVDGISEPRPDLAPDVINNSWSCPESEGCKEPLVLLEAVQNVRAAGILTVHSAGNSGDKCSTITTPAAFYAESFTVGATDSADNLASFSSRGPVTVDGSNRLKPDISAPGVGITSCVISGGYAAWNGTSMAAPHVAGLAALLISADPDLRGDVDALEIIIEHSAKGISSSLCSSSGVPNNLYGWGRIQALEAYRLLMLQRFFLPMTVKEIQR